MTVGLFAGASRSELDADCRARGALYTPGTFAFAQAGPLPRGHAKPCRLPPRSLRPLFTTTTAATERRSLPQTFVVASPLVVSISFSLLLHACMHASARYCTHFRFVSTFSLSELSLSYAPRPRILLLRSVSPAAIFPLAYTSGAAARQSVESSGVHFKRGNRLRLATFLLAREVIIVIMGVPIRTVRKSNENSYELITTIDFPLGKSEHFLN